MTSYAISSAYNTVLVLFLSLYCIFTLDHSANSIPFIFYRPKHPVKVHVWAGISVHGRTGVCIFEGIMDADGYVSILEEALLSFLRDVYLDGHGFVQDNDPKHTAKHTLPYFLQNGMNWFKTPPESTDLNPIENL